MTRPSPRMLEHRARRARSASSDGAAPSRSTRGSAPVKSITVDAVPGSSPPSSTTAAARSSLGHVLEPARVGARRAGSRSSRRRRRRCRAAPSRPRRGRGRARRSSPGSRRSARGSAERGSRARACTGRAAVRARSSPHGRAAPARTRAACSRSAATSAVGCSSVASLRAVERSHRGLGVRARREAVDGVGRHDGEPAGADRRGRGRRRQSRRPSTTRSRPVRSGRRADVGVAELTEQRGRLRAPGRRRPRRRASRRAGARRAPLARPRRWRRWPTSATCGSKSRTSGISVGRSSGST